MHLGMQAVSILSGTNKGVTMASLERDVIELEGGGDHPPEEIRLPWMPCLHS